MITHTMQSKLPNASASEFYKFMLTPPAEVYDKWLPEEHYECHLVKHGNDSPVGDLIYFDQNIGGVHRMKFHAVIKIAEKPNHILFQMQRFGVALPGYLELKFQDTLEGLLLTEEIRIGYRGLGKVFDPFIKLVYGKKFFKALDGHHKREWECLAKILKF